MSKSLINLIVLPVSWVVAICLIVVLFVLAHLPRVFSGRYYHYLGRIWCRVFVRGLDVDLKLVSRNKLPIPRQYILIANHPSALEDFGVPALFDIYPLAKSEVRDWFILGRISDYSGTVYVERDNADSRQAALQSLIDAVQHGKNIVIFPEGGCKGSRIYEKFHTGAFEIAITTGVPVLPVFLQYVDQATFEWKEETLVKKLWQIFRAKNGEVNYYVHDAIDPSAYEDKRVFAKEVHAMYLEWQKVYLDPLSDISVS